MIDMNTPQPNTDDSQWWDARFNEVSRIYANSIQGEQSVSMVQAKVVDPRYEPQNGIYETEYNGFEISLGPWTLIHSKEDI